MSAMQDDERHPDWSNVVDMPTVDEDAECAYCGNELPAAAERPDVPYCSFRCERADNFGDPRWKP